MKNLLLLLTLSFALKASCQNITFAGIGLSSVKIENLTKGANITLNPGETLTLSLTTDISNVENKKSSGIKIYPNPMVEYSTLEILPTSEGNAAIVVFEMSGKKLAQVNTYMENSLQKFKISGLKSGIYLINVTGHSFQFSGKLVCLGKPTGTINIEKISKEIQTIDKKVIKMNYKGAQESPSLLYSNGDKLLFTGTSGNNATIIATKAITQDTTITFAFFACTDGSGNNYPVVQIGTQIWMADNLKTTKYNDGSSIPLVVNNSDWGNLTSAGYCWYNNDEATYKPHYGALYNWYTVNSGTLCPNGWHVSSDNEWTTLTTFLGGENIAGGKLKETGTAHWITPNSGATNETGFTAFPGDARYLDGTFKFFGAYCHFWSSSEQNNDESKLRYLTNDWEGVANISADKSFGLSVRCLRDIYIETETAINDTLALCYTKLYDYMEFAYLFDAVYSNHISAPNSTWTEIYQHTQTSSSDNAKILKLWSKAYDIIYKTNLIIKSSEIVISDQATRDGIIAQAKAIRSYINYNLLIWFGEVPLETGITEEMIPRSSIEQVLSSIKLDATNASQYLPVSWPISDKFRMTLFFVKGLLSRAALYSKSYTEALSPTQQIINSGMYALSTDTINFTSSNTEILWGFDKGSNTEFNNFFNKGSFVPAIRCTESFLISAEALLNTGNTSSALTYINMLNARRGRPNLASLTSNDILQHWNTQMIKEGSMFVTLKRFDKALSVVQYFPHKLLLPVPLYYLNKNPYLTQNPGY